jgi:hypothetical protein
MEIICLQCGSVSKRAVRTIQGSFLLECFLWLLFILPGVIYSVWRLTTKAKVCPACSSREIVPLASPLGQKLQRELATVGSVPPSAIELPAAAEIRSRCSNCGQHSPARSSFCSHCGTKRAAGSESTHTTATPPNDSIRGGRLGWRVVGLIVGISFVVLVSTLTQRQPAASAQAKHREAAAAHPLRGNDYEVEVTGTPKTVVTGSIGVVHADGSYTQESVEGFTPKMFSASGRMVSAVFQKRLEFKKVGILRVIIRRNGVVIDQRETVAQNGVISVATR